MTLMTNLKRQGKPLSTLSDFKYSEEAHEKKKQQILDFISYLDEPILLAEGFELAFLGLGYSFNGIYAIYDLVISLEILMQRDGMTYDEAEEFFEYNVIGSYVGDRMPVFLDHLRKLEDEHIS
jgi:hypothetical protein